MKIFLQFIRFEIFFTIYFIFNSLGNLLRDGAENGFSGEEMLGVIIILTTYFPLIVIILLLILITTIFIYWFPLQGKEKILNKKLILYCLGFSVLSGLIGYFEIITLFW